MSKLAHLMCETCWSKNEDVDSDVHLTNAHDGRKCCYCGQRVEWSLIVHRHPDAVACKGIHERV